MYPLFVVVALGGLMFFASSKRRVDCYSLAFVSACVYFSPGFIGAVWGRGNILNHAEVYGVMTSVLLAIFLFSIAFSRKSVGPVTVRSSQFDVIAIRLVAVASVVGLIGTYYSVGWSALSYRDKVAAMDKLVLNRWYVAFAVGSMITTVTAFRMRKWHFFILGLGLLFFDVYVGFRSNFAMATIAIFLDHLHERGTIRLVAQKKRIVLVGVMLAASIFVYKFIYQRVKAGDFRSIEVSLRDTDFLVSTLTHSEPFLTQAILHRVLKSNFRTDVSYIAYGVFVSAQPINVGLFERPDTFNDKFQHRLFPGYRSGSLANNIWAQMIAAGDWPLFLLFLMIYSMSLAWGTRVLGRVATPFNRSTLCIGLSFWCFYIHRNDLGFQIHLEKQLIVLWAAIGAAAYLMTSRRRMSQQTDARPPRHNQVTRVTNTSSAS